MVSNQLGIILFSDFNAIIIPLNDFSEIEHIRKCVYSYISCIHNTSRCRDNGNPLAPRILAIHSPPFPTSILAVEKPIREQARISLFFLEKLIGTKNSDMGGFF
ncbi:hypothetical protein JGUZn3_13700 [Entomobacter blattae]|uniref:Uncharacterized protein n=1 Tax=Entomobacter blattae TaxID=2762277 RepID=A0A7H1NS36_9PROT|nr:hypothetical protein JGUZn3_13700 [Entomobacter blattae]